MNKLDIKIWLPVFLAGFMLLNGCETKNNNMDKLTEHVNKLISSANSDDEQAALSELLTMVRNTNINYGYRVFNDTKHKPTFREELANEMDDELMVTILVGDEPPYSEYKWKPKDNHHIQFLVMP